MVLALASLELCCWLSLAIGVTAFVVVKAGIALARRTPYRLGWIDGGLAFHGHELHPGRHLFGVDRLPKLVRSGQEVDMTDAAPRPTALDARRPVGAVLPFFVLVASLTGCPGDPGAGPIGVEPSQIDFGLVAAGVTPVLSQDLFFTSEIDRDATLVEVQIEGDTDVFSVTLPDGSAVAPPLEIRAGETIRLNVNFAAPVFEDAFQVTASFSFEVADATGGCSGGAAEPELFTRTVILLGEASCDLDEDGFVGTACEGEDCDDEDPGVHPGADEACDGVDNDCDGDVDEGFDGDGDGYLVCEDDCDDGDPSIHPGAEEVCDGIDNDCDGALGVGEEDADGDGVMVCDGDCDDGNLDVYPEAPEICDGLDNDCDGEMDEGAGVDADGDGWYDCSGDCDDGNALVYPGAAELCDGLDNDCDGAVPPLELLDLDADGYLYCNDCDDTMAETHPGAAELCDGADNDCDGSLPDDEADADGDGVLLCDSDCDDADPGVHPGAPELCDGLDNDCDGVVPVDEGDLDADGHTGCGGDCDDADPDSYPGAAEACDGADNDCDGLLPATEEDADGDGYRICEGDCDDGQDDTFPGAPELCDGADSDCDGVVPADEVDADGDGFRVCDGDCEDGDGSIHPLAPELCDFVDNDCDGALDLGETLDQDGDGYVYCEDCDDLSAESYPGAAEICDEEDNDCDGSLPPDEVADADGDGHVECLDCDDGDATSYPGAPELCDEVDNDCDGTIPGDEVDGDGDGYLVCEDGPAGGDCDDAEPTVYPGAPALCDGLDNDCDGLGDVDEGFDDVDGDDIANCVDECPVYADQANVSGLDDGTFDHPFLTIQEAVDQAGLVGCESVLVAQGTYVEDVDFDAVSTVVESVDGPELTTVQGTGTASVVTFDGGQEGAGIVGFTLTGGTGSPDQGWDEEGLHYGGGVYIAFTDALVQDCVITDNQVDGRGGGVFIYDAEAQVLDNEVSGNVASRLNNGGGGIAAMLADSRIDGNWITGNEATGFSGDGGGLVITESHDHVRANLITLNAAEGWGDGIRLTDGSALFEGNVVQDNHGDGVTVSHYDTSSVVNNTIVGNTEVGLFVYTYNEGYAVPAVANNIIAFNGTYGVRDNTGEGFTFVYNDVYGNGTADYDANLGDLTGIMGNISEDPLLVDFSDDLDPSNDDLHLSAVSPCIDAGMDAGVYGAVEDFDDVARPQDGDEDEYPWYDMGAFEYVP